MFLIKWLAILIYGRDNVEEFEKSNAKPIVKPKRKRRRQVKMKIYNTKWYRIEYDEDGERWLIISADANNNCGEVIDWYPTLKVALENARYFDKEGH